MFERLAAQAIRSPRRLDDHLLSALSQEREAAGFPDKPGTVPARLFWTYAGQLLSLPDYQPRDLDLLDRVMNAMTGCNSEALDQSRWFEKVGTRALLLAAEDRSYRWMKPVPEQIRLRSGEESIWIEEGVHLLRPEERWLVREDADWSSIGASVEVRGVGNVGYGASSTTTLRRVARLPRGELRSVGLVTVAVTDRRIGIYGNDPTFIKLKDVAGWVLPKAYPLVCGIIDQAKVEPVFLQCRNGLLMRMMIECAIGRLDS